VSNIVVQFVVAEEKEQRNSSEVTMVLSEVPVGPDRRSAVMPTNCIHLTHNWDWPAEVAAANAAISVETLVAIIFDRIISRPVIVGHACQSTFLYF